MNRNIFFAVIMILLFKSEFSFAENSWLTDKIKAVKDSQLNTISQSSLSDTKIGEGLKEALKVGIKNAIAKTGQPDGYLKNDAIKIDFPANFKMAENGLRMMGLGKTLDEFVVSMNRSAEKAVPLASDIFTDAIFDMSIKDAQKILGGSDHAATQYLKDKTFSKLKKSFGPMVQKVLAENDVMKKYRDIAAGYNSLPISKKMPLINPEDYVLSKSLDGLFVVLGEEEAKIRKDPSARVTDLLKEVFKQ